MNKSSRSSQIPGDVLRSMSLRPSRMSPLVVLVLVVGVFTPHLIAKARPHDDRLDGGHNSSQASQRLMKELKDFYKSDSYRRGLFTVELIDDNIYEWHVKLFVLDEKTQLYRDLKDLKRNGGNDHILLHLKYNDNYPNEPPFVRVVFPHLSGILTSGGICMELLGPGWNREYTIEPLILSIAAELSETEVRSDLNPSYDYEAAKTMFDSLTRQHLKEGYWTTTPAP